MKKTNRKWWIALLLVLLAFGGFVLFSTLSAQESYLGLTNEVKKKVPTLKRSQLSKINKQIMEAYQKYKIEDKDLDYKLLAASLENDQYGGRIVSKISYTYRFKIDVVTLEVEFVEIADRKLGQEEFERGDGGLVE